MDKEPGPFQPAPRTCPTLALVCVTWGVTGWGAPHSGGPALKAFTRRLGRQQKRVNSCLDWLDAKLPTQAPEGFWPGCFSVADISLVCALDFADKHKIYDWQNRASLKERVEQLSERPSVTATRAP